MEKAQTFRRIVSGENNEDEWK